MILQIITMDMTLVVRLDNMVSDIIPYKYHIYTTLLNYYRNTINNLTLEYLHSWNYFKKSHITVVYIDGNM